MTFKKLDASQKAFITKKVKALGSMKAVKGCYRKPCLVTRYALSVAKKELKGE